MLNAECKMLNEGVRFADIILYHFRIISEGNTAILH